MIDENKTSTFYLFYIPFSCSVFLSVFIIFIVNFLNFYKNIPNNILIHNWLVLLYLSCFVALLTSDIFYVPLLNMNFCHFGGTVGVALFYLANYCKNVLSLIIQKQIFKKFRYLSPFSDSDKRNT